LSLLINIIHQLFLINIYNKFKAISMTDGYIDGQQIKVCPSQADKNRAALAAAKLKVQT
jgi:hypothetical protein